MHNLPTALMSTFADLVADEARSALPDAPVHATPTPPVRRVRPARARRAMAGALHRAADLVGPPTPA